jgi:hypothetical protein
MLEFFRAAVKQLAENTRETAGSLENQANSMLPAAALLRSRIKMESKMTTERMPDQSRKGVAPGGEEKQTVVEFLTV